MSKLVRYFYMFKRAIKNLVYLDDHVNHLNSSILHINHSIKYNIESKRLESLALNETTMGTQDIINNRELIVSLTSHGKRIHFVFRTIESIFQQTYKANRIILWLGDREFNSVSELPLILQKQVARGLEIRFVKDIRSYTKLIPALKEFPEANIVTIDDDILYPFDLLERLTATHRNYPKAVCCMAMRKLELKGLKSFYPYKKKEIEYVKGNIDTTNYIAEGFAGVLYPANCFPKEVFNEEVFLRIAPNADDIWFKAMEMLNNTQIIPLESISPIWEQILVDENTQDISLMNENIFMNRNDIQIKAVFDYYNLYHKLIK